MLKKKIMAVSISFLLIGCSTVESSLDSIVLNQTFDDSFTHTINNQNTLEDNKALLHSIQSDKEVMAILKNNTNKNDPNYDAFLKYKSLVDLVVIEEQQKINNKEKQVVTNKENTPQKTAIKTPKAADESFKKVEQNSLKKEESRKTKSIEEEFNETAISADTEIEIKNTIKEQKKTVEVNKEPEIKKNDTVSKVTESDISKSKANLDLEETSFIDEKALKKQYLNIKDKLKNHHYIILSHCNIEDAHLIFEDIENYKNKVLSLSNNNQELANYSVQINEHDFRRCLDLFTNNQSFEENIEN